MGLLNHRARGTVCPRLASPGNRGRDERAGGLLGHDVRGNTRSWGELDWAEWGSSGDTAAAGAPASLSVLCSWVPLKSCPRRRQGPIPGHQPLTGCGLPEEGLD